MPTRVQNDRGGGGAFRLRVRGPFAFFKRPESVLWPTSYPLPTPSAAQGILSAVYWHPGVEWRVQEIKILSLGEEYRMMRNEVKAKASHASTERTFVLGQNMRTQRAYRMLTDVDYVIQASMRLLPSADKEIGGYLDQFRRRVEKGQYFKPPALGLHRCVASEFGFSNPDKEIQEPSALIDDQFLMLFGMDHYSPLDAKPPIYFDATLKAGVLEVPEYLYDRLTPPRGGEGAPRP